MTAATAPAEDAPYGANVEQELAAITNRAATHSPPLEPPAPDDSNPCNGRIHSRTPSGSCLLYTSDAADEEDSVDLGGCRIIKKKKKNKKKKKKKKKK